MDRNFSDEQLDRIAAKLIADFAADEQTVAEVADSPKLWWSVRSAIATEQARRETSWFAFLRPRLVAFAGAAALVLVAFSAFLMTRGGGNEVAGLSDVTAPSIEEISTPVETIAPTIVPVKPEVSSQANPERATTPVLKTTPKPRPIVTAERAPAPKSVKQPNAATTAKVEETKTDFIALSYAGASDGGQIVRVKVPSAMMVSLGVAANAGKDSEMVSAEIVVGDDGLARAIRFIR